MSGLLAQIVPMALAAAISPVLFLLQLTTLTGRRPIARGAAVTAGAAAVLIVVSTAGVSLGGSGFSDNDSLQAVVSILFGALLIAVGLRALVHPPTPKPHDPDAKPKGTWRSFVAGAGGMASNLTTFALYVPALALIAASGLPLGQRGLAALVILTVTLTVVWIPLVLAVAIPGGSSRVLRAVGDWMTANNRWIQVTLGFGFGIWLVAKGVEAT